MIDIKKAFTAIEDIIPVVGGILVKIVLYALILGVLLDVATSGSIGVISGVATFLNGTMATDSVTALTSLNTVTKTVITLIVVVILIVLFKIGQKGKSAGSSM